MLPNRSWRMLLAAGLLSSLLGACGGGGDSTPVTPVTPIADTAEAWWNGETAGRWAYKVTDTRPGYAASRVNLVTVGQNSGLPGVVNFIHSSSILDGLRMEEPRFFDGQAIQAVLDPTTGEAYPEIPAPLVADEPKTVYDESVGFDLEGEPVTLRIVVTITLGVEASRSVPAGSFSNVLRAVTKFTATITLVRTGESETADETLTIWYAPGVGPIRREFVDPTFTVPNNVAYEELSGVSVAAVKAGIVPGFVALDAIGAGNSSAPAGIPSMASDGTNVLVASRALVEPSIERLVATILAPDGTALWRGTVIDQVGVDMVTGGAYTAAAFDGQNFQVFWMAPTGGAQLVGRRIAPDGTLLGDPAGTPVGTGTGLIGRVAAASNGTDVLVVWQRYDDARQAYVTEGRTVDRSGIGVSPVFDLGAGEADISVAWSGSRYLVAKASPMGSSVAIVPVGPGGVPDNDWQEVPESGPFATDPRVTAHPDGFVVGWTSWASPPNAGIENRILARRIRYDGVVLDAADIVIDGNPVAGRFGFALTTSAQGLFAGWVKDLTLDPMQSADRARAALAPWITGTTAFDNPASYWGPYWYTTPDLAPPADAYPVAVAAGDRFMMVWLENLQSSATPSDRVVATIVYPPTAR